MKINFLKKSDLELLVKSVAYIKPYKSKCILLISFVLIGITFRLIQPLILSEVTVNFLNGQYHVLTRSIFLLCVLHISETVFDLAKSIYFSEVNNSIMYDINRDIYKKVIDLQVVAFDEMRIGDFISLLNGDTEVISNIITNHLLNGIADIIKVVAIGVIIFKINVILALITTIAFPISYTIFLLFGRVLRKKNTELREIYDSFFSIVQQSLAGIRDVKCLDLKNKVVNKFLQISDALKKKSIDISITSAFSRSASKSVTFLISMIVLCISGYFVLKETLSIGVFITFIAYSSQFSESLRNITELNSSAQQLLSSLERVYNLIDNITYKNEVFGTRSITDLKGDIKFCNVRFGYTKDKLVFNNLTFHIEPNKKIAIVGRSGIGKSTIFNLLLKFYNPDSGHIEIDDININELNEETLRKNIAFIRQDPFLFNMTIKDNLLIASDKANDEDIINACKAACIHDYIISLPQKYDSIIGENGVNLSGGQKQRIAIARGLLKNSKIILFDEATSSLDNESQYVIKRAIDNISKDRTVIIIAHRLSTIIDADEILVVGETGLVGRGSHFNLINKNNLYRKLYETELRALNDIEGTIV